MCEVNSSKRKNVMGVFEYEWIDDGYDDSIMYMECVLLRPIGDLPAGQRIDDILVAVYADFTAEFKHNGRAYKFGMKARPVDVTIEQAQEPAQAQT